MCLIAEHARALQRIKELEAQIPPPMPPPPASQLTIDANSLSALVFPWGINLSGGSGDYQYKLLSKSEAESFLKWYKANAPIKPSEYTADNLDCDKFAWEMRAQAILWMRGEYAWGYIEAEGADPDWSFPNHGFCFVPCDDFKVYFYDQLEVAAPDDELMEAYQVKCHAAKI